MDLNIGGHHANDTANTSQKRMGGYVGSVSAPHRSEVTGIAMKCSRLGLPAAASWFIKLSGAMIKRL
jgi:hypothetical protein